MEAAYHSREFRGFMRILPLVVIALGLVAPRWAWGDCSQGIASVTFNQGSNIALAPLLWGGAARTVKLNCPSWYEPNIIAISVMPNNGVLSCTQTGVPEGGLTGGFSCGASANGSGGFNVTATIVEQTWGGGSTGSEGLAVVANGPPATGPNQGTCGINGCPCVAGAPINLTDGNTWIQERDYAVPGLGGGLQLSRVWNNRLGYATPPAMAGMFGFGWRSTYEEMLAGPHSNNHMAYWRADCSAWSFTYNSGTGAYSLISPADERAQLVLNPATGVFTITFAGMAQKVFNSQNFLAANIDRNHNQTTLAYDSSNRLTTVTSAGGTTLTFTYGDPNNPTQATRVQDAVGTVATYVYDSSSRLTSVTYTDRSGFSFSYDPNSSMILSVTDSQGKLIESHTYDNQNRGLTSSRAYGVDSVSLSY